MMPLPEGLNIFNFLIEKLSNAFKLHHSNNLVLAVHFGSTARGELKPYTDIDLYLAFKKLESDRFKSQELFNIYEESVKYEIKQLYMGGFHLDFSPHIYSAESIFVFKRFYLDFPEEAKILFQVNENGTELIQKIVEMRITQNIQLKHFNGIRVWDGSGNLKPGEKFNPKLGGVDN
jgi:predicted nucleotidyltransferase